MKKVNVIDGVDGEWILIENLYDLMDYAENLKKETTELIERLLKSGVSVSRWDHLITKNDAGSILAAMVLKVNTFGCRPLVEMENLVSLKVKSISSYLKEGNSVIVNDVGGYSKVHKEWTFKLISENDKKNHSNYYKINKNTRYINIENDETMEDFAKKYLSKKDECYSYVLNLYSFSQEELMAIFEEFKQEGGEILYVYTTGLNVPQMYAYTEAAMKAGIKNFEFDFNSGINEDIKKYLTETEKKGVSVSYRVSFKS